ncbi:uncharacterized protein LOC124123198 [Haliotis rufescens]|uniref:uncharacterized protein LOC124123198 n=1 Tax=Haliotis rufescens TaxID=6454 RepID=UPI00201F74F1|nr:uncharacterized protein LOC124123198 [Haliotis rufescens]
MKELRLDDPESFYNFLRITPPMFDEILERIASFIQKEDTNYRKALEQGVKLAITLRHLQQEIPMPPCNMSSGDTWEDVAEEFLMRWNVPHDCDALDGKHVTIRKPPKTGTMYRNYKGFFSVVLMALVDADYKFLWIVVGGVGSQSDAQIYNQSELKECLVDGSIGFPPPSTLPNDVKDSP